MNSPSVLVIRLDAIGDALSLTPMLAAFRARGIPVDLVMTQANANVFARAARREVFVAPFDLRSSTRTTIANIRAFGERLQSHRYSHTLVATEDPGGYRLARAVASPSRVGFSNGWGKPFKTLWVQTMLTRTIVRSAGLDPHAPHECAVQFSLASELLPNDQPTRDIALLRPLILESDPQPDPRIAFQITNKWERLGIPLDDVVTAFSIASHHAELRLVGSAHEESYVRRFEAAAATRVEIFDELEAWKEAIASAAALIAPDSGAIHIAGMTGTPTLAVFDPHSPFSLQSARWSPWAAPSVNLRGAKGWFDSITSALPKLVRPALL